MKMMWMYERIPSVFTVCHCLEVEATALLTSNQGAGDTGPEYLHSEMQLGGSPPSTLPQGTVAEERTVGW